MRTIDADALRQTMYHEAFETDTDMQKWDGGCWIRYKMFENAVENTPTIVTERKTGRWIVCKRYRRLGGLCSECGFFATLRYNYCPNCGARMEVEHEQ